MSYKFIIPVWLFCLVLKDGLGQQWDDAMLEISQLEAHRHSLVFRVTMNDTWPVPLSDSAVQLKLRCVAGPPIYPRLTNWEYSDKVLYPLYKLGRRLPPGMEEFHHCTNENSWEPPTAKLFLLDPEKYTYKLENLISDAQYEISAEGYYSWSNNTAEKVLVSDSVYTESLDPPVIKEGYFWIQNQTKSSTQRTVTLFWEKTIGEGVLEQFEDNKQLPDSTKIISLMTGYLTTSISMAKNTFRFYRKSIINDSTDGHRFSSVDVPSRENIASTSTWANTYTQWNDSIGRIQWMQNRDGTEPDATDFIVIWFSSDAIVFEHIPPTFEGITIDAPPPAAVGLSINFATKSTGMMPLYGLNSTTKIEDLFSSINSADKFKKSSVTESSIATSNVNRKSTSLYPQLDTGDTEHVEKAYDGKSKKINPQNTRIIPSDMEHVQDVYEPKRPQKTPN